MTDSRFTDAQLEAKRKEVALEMLHDPEMKQRVEKIVGVEQAKIRYREAYEE